MNSSKQVVLQEVAPRDGWQIIRDYIDLDVKKKMIEAILKTGISEIEFTAFVSPKWVVQMSDAEKLCAWLLPLVKEKYPSVKLGALVPNAKGALRALEAGVENLHAVLSISETNNRLNLNMSIEDSFAQLKKIFEICNNPENIHVCFTCVWGEHEGEIIDYDRLCRYIDELVALGVGRITLGDSAGLGNPAKVREIISMVKEHVPLEKLSLHAHDTRGTGLANCYAAYCEGVTHFDTSLGGLGGCPFLPGASGNVSTEDVARMFEQMGLDTGLNFDEVHSASLQMAQSVTGKYNSKMQEIYLLHEQKKEKDWASITALAGELAVENFKTGLNCAESVVDALIRSGALSEHDNPLPAATGFGGGIGLSGHVCGALSGAILANSIVYGRKNPHSVPAETRMTEVGEKYYRRYNNIVHDFEKFAGAADCKEISSSYGDFHCKERKVNCLKIIKNAAMLACRYLSMPQDEAFTLPYGENMSGLQ